MAWTKALIWLSCLLVLFSLSLAESIGINWGTMASHPLQPLVVVQLLKDNGIKKVKLFDSDHWTVSAFANSNIEVTIAIPNDQLSRFSDDYGNAKDWVKENVTSHLKNPGGVKIKYVGVGNEPFLKSYNGSFMKSTFPALKNIQKALDEAGHGDEIKATIPLNADVYESSSDKPSGGSFRSDIKTLMTDIVHFLHNNKAPFFVNIYPFLSLYLNPNFPINFAFFEGADKPIQDNNIQYTNVFDANYDTLVWSLKNAGVPDLKIVVGEVGWPTDGDKHGTIELAQKWYSGFMKKMASDKGTPLRPGPLDVYLFGLVDENMKSIAPGSFERHWGIFRYDGNPKFPLDLSGKGHEKELVPAKGVLYLPSQWCVFDKSATNLKDVPANMNYACSLADCTPLGFGSSCNNLDNYGNMSYAFNIYYQMQDQDVEACNFQGLAKLTKQNPSTGHCVFPIEIMSSGERLKFLHVTSALLLLLIVAILM
ncbi:hypothetical protein Syun_013734 [Stephania yunnanensis]|uniref:glucan endo-1,3-beta-D-glucosidase n=1 Tax=Stephania yunnanensis TaxID=152371 RepID=A0AAP0JIE8_9MAGN